MLDSWPAEIVQMNPPFDSNNILRHIFAGVTGHIGEKYFSALVQNLAEAFGAQYSLIGVSDNPDDPRRIQTLAVFARGSTTSNFSYDLLDTPCDKVNSGTPCVYPTKVQLAFPHDALLREMDVESYAGTPLVSADGRVLGLLVVLDDKPMEQPEIIKDILRLFAVPAVRELERYSNEKTVRHQEMLGIRELRTRDLRLRRQRQAMLEVSRAQMQLGIEPDTIIRIATEATTQALQVERASVWFYSTHRDAIHCTDLYERSTNTHSQGISLSVKDYPSYFAAIAADQLIVADDAQNFPATLEFTQSYLRPLGITSMLDAPIRRGAQTVAVLCHEHIGPLRPWSLDEQNFAASMADMISLTLELWEHKKTSEELQRHRDHLEDLVAVRTAELRSVNKELEAFSYSVSHDLRAPLRAIDGFAAALQTSLADKFNAKDLADFTRIRSAAQNMATLIEDLLCLSRMSRVEMNMGIVDISALAADSVRKHKEGDPQRKVDIRIADGLSARADPGLLAIAVDNLLSNAWKYTLKTPNPSVTMGVEYQAGETVYFVRDNGAGFDPRYASKLFGPFQRLHGNDEFPGSGIGLATVARIINRHGGRIWAEGSVGEGATFYFTLAENDHDRRALNNTNQPPLNA